MLTWLYKSVIQLRNTAYNNTLFSSEKVSKPVVSIGNITMGGTGKTPIADHLIRWSQSHNLNSGVVSRGYGGEFKGVQKVTPGAAPEVFGDEPTMLALRNPQSPIYVCPDRVLAAKTLIANEDIDLIFADDAFQHRRLARDIDIVVIDLLESTKNYQLIPSGRAREPLSSLNRANFIILNKANFVSEQKYQEVCSFLSEYVSEGVPFIKGIYSPGKLKALQGSSEAKNKKWVLLSAIGNPKSFESLVEGMDFEISHHFIYKDHYRYSTSDIYKITKEVKSRGCDGVLFTEKDAVKLKPLLNQTDLNWCYLEINVQLEGASQLYDSLVRLNS